MRYFLLIFVAVPLVELWLLIRVGRVIGALPTVALVVLTTVVGLWLLRRQGYASVLRARSQMSQGEAPVQAMADGLLLAIAGFLLVLPGFLTDALGGLLLLPQVRLWLGSGLLARMGTRAWVFTARGAGRPFGDDREILDGEYTRADRREDAPRVLPGHDRDEHQ